MTLKKLLTQLITKLFYVNCYTLVLTRQLLSLNVAKTELMIIGSRQRLNVQCEEITISIDGRTIKRVDHTKSLGLIPLMLNSLGLNTLTKYARKPLQQLVH